MKESCHTYEWVTYVWVTPLIWVSHVAHRHSRTYAYEWRSHVAHMSESSCMYEWVMSHTGIRRRIQVAPCCGCPRQHWTSGVLCQNWPPFFERNPPDSSRPHPGVCLFLRLSVCCSVLQCVAVCCSVLQCVAVCSPRYFNHKFRILRVHIQVCVCGCVYGCVAVCCSVLQCVAPSCLTIFSRFLSICVSVAVSMAV